MQPEQGHQVGHHFSGDVGAFWTAKWVKSYDSCLTMSCLEGVQACGSSVHPFILSFIQSCSCLFSKHLLSGRCVLGTVPGARKTKFKGDTIPALRELLVMNCQLPLSLGWNFKNISCSYHLQSSPLCLLVPSPYGRNAQKHTHTPLLSVFLNP